MNFKFLTIIFLLTSTFSFSRVQAQLFDRPDFFRRGDEQLEQEIRNFQQRQPDSILNISPQTPSSSWHPLLFQEAGFSIWMPEGVFSEENITLKIPTEPIEFELFSSRPLSEQFLVAYSDNLASERLKNPGGLLEQLRDEIINKTKFQLTQERSIALGKYSGKEFSVEDNSESITFRIYLIEQRLYVLGVSQKTEEKQLERTAIFFNSFRLLS